MTGVKKIKKNTIYPIIIILIVTIFIVSSALAQVDTNPETPDPKDPGDGDSGDSFSSQRCTADTRACLSEITNSGFGAVELCRECFPCGLADGVCPENFTDGNNETYSHKTQMILKTGQDRPANHPDTAEQTIQYNTGVAACNKLAGDCTEIMEKDKRNDNWENSSKTCQTNMQTLLDDEDDKFYMAICENVPKTAGCYDCPDPDCKVTVKGYAYENSTDENKSVDVEVNAVSENNWRLRHNTKASGGEFEFTASRGNMEVICTYQDYLPSRTEMYLQPGTNIVDCVMEEAYCAFNPSCTMPNDEGIQVCRTRCDGENGCEYKNAINPNNISKTEYASELCNNMQPGGRVIVEKIAETTLWGVECCTGDFDYYKINKFKIEENKHIKNLLTKSVRKTLNGEPVELKIIVYEKLPE